MEDVKSTLCETKGCLNKRQCPICKMCQDHHDKEINNNSEDSKSELKNLVMFCKICNHKFTINDDWTYNGSECEHHNLNNDAKDSKSAPKGCGKECDENFPETYVCGVDSFEGKISLCPECRENTKEVTKNEAN